MLDWVHFDWVKPGLNHSIVLTGYNLTTTLDVFERILMRTFLSKLTLYCR